MGPMKTPSQMQLCNRLSMGAREGFGFRMHGIYIHTPQEKSQDLLTILMHSAPCLRARVQG